MDLLLFLVFWEPKLSEFMYNKSSLCQYHKHVLSGNFKYPATHFTFHVIERLRTWLLFVSYFFFFTFAFSFLPFINIVDKEIPRQRTRKALEWSIQFHASYYHISPCCPHHHSPAQNPYSASHGCSILV